MKGEDLFLAIGSVEEFRLARSELHVSSGNKQEEKYMKRKSARTMRNLLVAVMIISTLAVAAYAVGGLLIFDSPADMIAAIFGDHTGFDHVAGGDIINQQGDILIERPGFQRVPVDETVVWVCCVPLAYCLSRFTDITILPLFAICLSTDLLKCVIGAVMLKQGKWIQNLTA